MANYKSVIPMGILIHVKDNIYKKRRIYRKYSFNQYYAKTQCFQCGKEIFRDASNFRKNPNNGYCSKECRYLAKNIKMEGTIKYRRGNKLKGHKLIYLPNHPYAKKNFYSLHRYIMEQHLGHILNPSEIVHHIDCDKENNEINNLIVVNNHTKHSLIHGSLNKCVSILMKKKEIKYNYETNEYYVEGM